MASMLYPPPLVSGGRPRPLPPRRVRPFRDGIWRGSLRPWGEPNPEKLGLTTPRIRFGHRDEGDSPRLPRREGADSDAHLSRRGSLLIREAMPWNRPRLSEKRDMCKSVLRLSQGQIEAAHERSTRFFQPRSVRA